MEKSIACDRVVPGCGFTARAETEAQLLQQVAEHARDAHGVTDVTPELLEKVRAAIQTVPGRS